MDDSVNETMSKYIINILNVDDKINNWINGGYKKYPLIIYGRDGTGKTKLANYILRDWVRIIINVEMCKSGLIFNEYIKSSLYKKSITMMFSNNKYKSLIIDDISYIQTNDKKLYKSIIDFSKSNQNIHPIIYIFNNINHRTIQLLIKNSNLIHMKFTHNNLENIIKKFLDKGISSSEINKLIINSNYNLNSIITNINFYKNNYNNIKIYDKKETELSLFIKNILNSYIIDDIYSKSYSDYNIIGLNILENIYNWMVLNKNIPYKTRINLIENIYYNTCISDYILNKMYITNDWNLINHIITNSIVYPYYIIKMNNINIDKIEYNKYISRCIIYTYNNNLLYKYKFDHIKLSYLYYLIKEFLSNKDKYILIKINKIIKDYNLSLKFIEKFTKYYKYNINKKNIKTFYT